jgi:AcrR family transcriptional regulator
MNARPAVAPARRARSGPKRGGTSGKRSAGPRSQLRREDWILAARTTLIRDGINAVNVLPLAGKLKVTRGGFYWHFRNRADLLDALLADWEANNTAAFEKVIAEGGRDGRAEFVAMVDVWVAEHDYDPAWDAAVRQWALQSPRVARVVKLVDEHRIELFRQIFLDLGYVDPEALVRARITYFHQVGYYTLGLGESHEERMRLLPYYLSSLMGSAHDDRRAG